MGSHRHYPEGRTPELMQKERIYLEALTKTSRAIVKGPALQLQSDDGTTALPFVEAGQ